MKQPVSISIIAPIYRVEKYIGRFAESVLGQSYPHLQFIFVNDETDDSSIEILTSLINARYIHLKDRTLIVNQSHAGLPAARREGMNYATGDYIWHVDSDDWVEPDAASKIAECAEKTGADVIYFDFYREYAEKTYLEVEQDYDDSQTLVYQKHIYDHKAYGCVWNKCVKRDLYRNNTIHFPKYSHAEDTFLMSQLLGYAGSLVHLDESLYHYRKDNPNALTRQGRKMRCRELILNYLTLYELYKDAPCSPVASIEQDVFYRAGKYSLMYRLGLFDEYPYLADKILKSRIRFHSYTSVPAQLVLKAYACFCRR